MSTNPDQTWAAVAVRVMLARCFLSIAKAMQDAAEGL